MRELSAASETMPALPDRVEQLVLADDPIAVPHQIGEHVEHLRLDRHGMRRRAAIPAARGRPHRCRSGKSILPPFGTSLLIAPPAGGRRASLDDGRGSSRIPRLEISRKSPEKSRPAGAGVQALRAEQFRAYCANAAHCRSRHRTSGAIARTNPWRKRDHVHHRSSFGPENEAIRATSRNCHDAGRAAPDRRAVRPTPAAKPVACARRSCGDNAGTPTIARAIRTCAAVRARLAATPVELRPTALCRADRPTTSDREEL